LVETIVRIALHLASIGQRTVVRLRQRWRCAFGSVTCRISRYEPRHSHARSWAGIFPFGGEHFPGAEDARSTLANATELRYEGMAVYFVAMVGFLCFYGLDHLRGRVRDGDGYSLHLAGFAVYVLLVAYLLVRNLDHTRWSLAAYAVAMICHFLAIDHALRQEHGAAFDRRGRFVLATTCVLGWGAALLFAVSPFVVALLLAFVGGRHYEQRDHGTAVREGRAFLAIRDRRPDVRVLAAAVGLTADHPCGRHVSTHWLNQSGASRVLVALILAIAPYVVRHDCRRGCART
jgi:hypothetical protein